MGMMRPRPLMPPACGEGEQSLPASGSRVGVGCVLTEQMRGFQHDVPRSLLCCGRSSSLELPICVESAQCPQDSFDSQTLGRLCLRGRGFRASRDSAKGRHPFLAVELEEGAAQWTKEHAVRRPVHLAEMLLTLPGWVAPDKTPPKHAAWFSSLNKEM